jgi:PAS domain S-box-containing protein
MTYNYSDFDLSAFINSPMQTDVAPLASVNQAKTVHGNAINTPSMYSSATGMYSAGGDFATTTSSPATNWSAPQQQQYPQHDQVSALQRAPVKSNLPLDAHAQTLSIQGESESGIDTPSRTEMEYCSRIAAHHASQLHMAVPVPPASTPDGRLWGTFRENNPTASLQRQLGRKAIEPPQAPRLSLQERRRNARRALNQQNQQAQAADSAKHGVVAPAPSGSSGINTSGRSAKRAMTTSSGHIHGPESTASHRAPALNKRPPLHGQISAAHSVLSDYLPHESVAPTPNKNDADVSKPTPSVGAASRQAYSATGFDMLGALARVVLRPNPRILLGPVDLSASFTICDARHPEQPIVYCSDTFCELTGYSRDEILGRNCRFLQSPTGRVRSGSERSHTDNAAVLHLKQHSRAMQECQASLINYRKDGTPFINLVTVVPIPWGNSTEPVYLVGFQVDLVEQPSAVLQRAANGTYVVNYSTGSGAPTMPSRVTDSVTPAPTRDFEQEAAAREVSVGKELAEIIGGEGAGNHDSTQWARILLQHSQDLIHVLSLKGTFLYVSPSVERLLGWKPEELMGKSISDFCHPSDVVPVFRELKDSTSNASINAAAKRSFRTDGNTNRATKGGVGQGGPEVNLLMRMRHKNDSFVWIESKGKLHLEQGKGRKVVISSARSRPVYNLPWEPVKATVNSDQPAFWAKVSNDGLVLSATEGVEAVIDGTDSSLLYGKHLHQMVNKEAMPALLEALRGVQVATVVHQMFNAVDEPVWVKSTMYPSAVMPGTHIIPTVFVHVALITPGSHFFESSKKNTVEAKELASLGVDATADASGVPGSSVFGELATHRSSSHIFELHSLKHANRRLREDVRSAQRRVCARQGFEPTEGMALPKDQSSTAHHPTAPLKEGFVKAFDEQQEKEKEKEKDHPKSNSGGNTHAAASLRAQPTQKPHRPLLAPPRPSTTSSSSSSRGNSSSAGEGGSSNSAGFSMGDRATTNSGGNSSEETAATSLPSSSGDSSDASDPDVAKSAAAKKAQMVSAA